MTDVIHSLWFGLAALCLTGALFSWIFRAARIPGGSPSAAIAGGMVAGILLGASVLPSVNSDIWMHWYTGGVNENQPLAELTKQHLDRTNALRSAGVTETAITELRIQYREKAIPLFEALADAKQKHRNTISKIVNAMFLLWITASILSSASTKSKNIRTAQAIASGALTALVAGGSTFLMLNLILQLPWQLYLGAALCAAVGALAFDVCSLRLNITQVAGLRLSNITALFIVFVSLFFVGNILSSIRFDIHLSMFIPLTILAGLFVSLLNISTHSFDRIARALLWAFLTPTLAAIALVYTPISLLIQAPYFWLILLIISITCHDGRWLGAWLGIRLFGTRAQKHSQWQLSASILDTGVGAAQAVLAGVLVIAGILPPILGTAVVLAALIIELCQPIRQPIARWMDNKFHPTAQDAPS